MENFFRRKEEEASRMAAIAARAEARAAALKDVKIGDPEADPLRSRVSRNFSSCCERRQALALKRNWRTGGKEGGEKA